MTDVLGQMWLPVLLVFFVTTVIVLGFLARRVPAERTPSDEEQAEDPGDGASS